MVEITELILIFQIKNNKKTCQDTRCCETEVYETTNFPWAKKTVPIKELSIS